jgi:PAS domain S-box-containing protein/putative nucleotidyltransferase with HDIG domain
VPELQPLDEYGAYQRLLAAMPVMLWTADAQGFWKHVNHEWTSYTGLVGDSWGFGFEEGLHPDDLPRTLAVWQEAVARKEHYQIQYRLQHWEGFYRWFLIRGVRVKDEVGTAVAWVGTCTDIDDQKQAELAAQNAQDAAVRALGLALEARDRETQGHTDRVTHLALRLGTALGLGSSDLDTLRLGAYLHDVGKLVVSDTLLLKPGALTLEEREEVRRHVLEGVRFAAALGFLSQEVLDVIRFHHERWDGLGYPAGLVGENIPLLARIFSVADVYDALISQRPYKAAWSPEQARAELVKQAGQQFDPEVVQVLLGLKEDGE